MKKNLKFIVFTLFYFFGFNAVAKDYFIHPAYGNDLFNGLSKKSAFKSLSAISKIKIMAGDRVFLANGVTYFGSIMLTNQYGAKGNPIVITSIKWDRNDAVEPAIIDFKNTASGILLQDCSFINVSNIELTANGYIDIDINVDMRCGVLVSAINDQKVSDIVISNMNIHDVYYENEGFVRGLEEVKSANGTQKYGWGIRVISSKMDNIITNVTIDNCKVNNVCHTGIKLTGNGKNISKVNIFNNVVESTGGPGIQMSGVQDVEVANNTVSHSGSNNDSRKWGRGSGLWTWGASNVLIQNNKFLYANGPGDSAGAHIDYNCDNIVIQYNLSAFNAGGFCEILGNNYNCIYRYNISVNDGHRVKGKNGAFQEGKVFWLSGYQGQKPRKGPVNSYFYNNTIYSNQEIEAKFAIDNTSSGIVIVNNIFCIKGLSKQVLEDQKKVNQIGNDTIKNVKFENNLFLHENTWPVSLQIQDAKPFFSNPLFENEGGLNIQDYLPKSQLLLQNLGIEIPILPECDFPLLFDLKMQKDIIGKRIEGFPTIGAIQIVPNKN